MSEVSRLRRLALVAAVPVAAIAVFGSTHGSAAGLDFSTVYVDGARGGGEPFVIYSHGGQDLVYSSHEGTTLTQSSNVTGGTNCDIVPADPTSSGGYLCTYNNQVNMWFSSDAGHTWHHSTGDPVATGFSDPSLTEDQCVSGACNVWNTGIDLANDALYASSDGGQTWVGTPQCPPNGGDRPWLAGGQNGEVFMATNANVGGHTIYHGTTTVAAGRNVAAACNPNGVTDSGGQGQIYYNHHDGSVIEPNCTGVSNGCLASTSGHLGIGLLPAASSVWASSTASPTGSFVNRAANGPAAGPGSIEHWPAIAVSTDTSAAAPAGTVYIVWDTAPRDSSTHNGCSGSTGSAIGNPSLLQNSIKLAYSNDEGQTWSAPITISNGPGTVMWPWVAAGANGNVSVVWYQADQSTDPDCDSANLVCQAQVPATTCPSNWSLRAENLYGVTSGSPTILAVNAVHDPVPGAQTSNPHPNGTIHVGKTCEGGTTCAATGEDRRLGDYFTNSLDQNGCVMIASGDTMQNAPVTNMPLPNSLPIFLQQSSGPSLTTGADCASLVSVPEVSTVIGLAGAATAAAILVGGARRRRARSARSRSAHA
jgi:hypothetical protein